MDYVLTFLVAYLVYLIVGLLPSVWEPTDVPGGRPAFNVVAVVQLIVLLVALFLLLRPALRST